MKNPLFLQNNLLPSGDKFVEGNSVIIQDVSRHHSGIYVCTADNDVGSPARAEIDLKVLCKFFRSIIRKEIVAENFFSSKNTHVYLTDPPEIEVDQTWIPTGEGIEAEVSCNIHAEPVASVSSIFLLRQHKKIFP